MVRPLIAYLLIVAVMSASFSRLFVYAGFELNRNYIATHLCENRDKPWLHCNGKCYFMKKIRQAEEKEKNDERQSQKNLFQEALFGQKAETRFYSHVVQVMQVPNHRFTLPVADLPIYQPPRLG
ncbi:hypothetical protein [Mucilaginibacter sp.]|uniref:hypothetical protein n=1 Tax=Mucilaginibacter sp. TaxID=1882438 RepID=UPI00283C6217|nr:hypothetical protein [Mucilaginibacter sp.]MDR3697675.1 hypothetical protein [Mucilaginibacter sp.]